MAELIEQINNLQIKRYTKRDPYYLTNVPTKRYLVVAPNGRVLEDRLTLDQARSWAKKTHDFIVKKPSKKLDIEIIRKKVVGDEEIKKMVGGLREKYYGRAPAYGERAWRVRGKKLDLIVWDLGNSNYEIVKIIRGK